MAKLSGEQVERLTGVLVDTLDEDDLQGIVYASTGDRLYEEFVGPNQPLKRTIRELLVQLEKSGLTSAVLRGVYGARPHRDDVRGEIIRLFPEAAAPSKESADLSVQSGGVVQADAPVRATAPGLQRNVRPNLAKLDVQVWGERLSQNQRRVCRIEHDGRAVGTGFLVGPEAVLSNWHVVEGAIKGGTLGKITCRFDYVRLADQSRQEGTVVPLHRDGCLDSRPYAPAEATPTPDTPEPGPGDLDYALLRLTPPGDGRGWVALPAGPVPLEAGAPLLILQHPDGGPMKLALDTDSIIGPNAGGTRIRYRTNTDPGSSGSPCFTMDWDFAALHHFGDPAWQAPLFNQGVPAHLIRHSIAERGCGAWLGGA